MALQNDNPINYKWKWLMLGLSAAYLVPELIFNTVLVDVAGSADTAENDLRPVELFGRTLSGIGVTLLAADLLIKGGAIGANLRKLIGISIVVWPIVFFGQKALVDNFLVEPSTAEQRQQAFASQWLSSALASRTVDIEGIPMDGGTEQSASEKTFLALFGGLVYMDDRFVESVRGQQTEIIDRHLRKQAYIDFDARYAEYSQLRERVKSDYEEYKSHRAAYNKEVAGIPNRVARYQKDLKNDLSDGWKSYQKGVTKAEKKVRDVALKAAPRISFFMEKIYGTCNKYATSAGERDCKKALEAKYDKEILDMGFGHIPASYWLVESEVTTADNVTRTAISAVMTMGFSLVVQGASKLMGDDGGWKDKDYSTTSDPGHYADRLLKHPKAITKMTEPLGGYPLSLGNYNAFLKHPVTAKKTRDQLAKKGIKLPSNWQANHDITFKSAVSKKVQQEIDNKWSQQTAERELDLPPNLNWARFQRHKSVQETIETEMGAYYVSPVLASWNNKQFASNVVERNIRRKTHETKEYIEASVSDFEDGGKYAENGKKALRSVVVPPISMAISLFLVITTAIKIPRNAFGLLRKQLKASPARRASRKSASITLLISLTITTIILSSVVIIPIATAGNQFSGENTAAHYFVDNVKERASSSASNALVWVLNTQPLIQPLGETLESNIGIYKMFTTITGHEKLVSITDITAESGPKTNRVKRRYEK